MSVYLIQIEQRQRRAPGANKNKSPTMGDDIGKQWLKVIKR